MLLATSEFWKLIEIFEARLRRITEWSRTEGKCTACAVMDSKLAQTKNISGMSATAQRTGELDGLRRLPYQSKRFAHPHSRLNN
jgi:hypothetical protein